MRDILYELNYMDNVLKRLSKPKREPIRTNIHNEVKWSNAYHHAGWFMPETSTDWLFANEYYRMTLEGKV